MAEKTNAKSDLDRLNELMVGLSNETEIIHMPDDTTIFAMAVPEAQAMVTIFLEPIWGVLMGYNREYDVLVVANISVGEKK